MVHLPAAHHRALERGGSAVRCQLVYLEGEAPLCGARAGEQCLHRGVQPGLGARRSEHPQRLGAATELAIQHEEGQPAEVVAVQVRNHHAGDGAGVDALGLERGQAGRAAVHEQMGVA